MSPETDYNSTDGLPQSELNPFEPGTIRDDSEFRFVSIHVDVIRQMIPSLGASAFVVYTLMKSYAWYGKIEVFPALDTLAEITGMSRQTIISAVKRLQDYKLVSVTKHRDPSGKQERNHYRLLSVEKALQSLKIRLGQAQQPSLKIRHESDQDSNIDQSLPSPAKAEPKPRKQDPIFNAISEYIFGVKPEQAKAIAGRVAKAKKALLLFRPELTDQEIIAFKMWWGQTHTINVPFDAEKLVTGFAAWWDGSNKPVDEYVIDPDTGAKVSKAYLENTKGGKHD